MTPLQRLRALLDALPKEGWDATVEPERTRAFEAIEEFEFEAHNQMGRLLAVCEAVQQARNNGLPVPLKITDALRALQSSVMPSSPPSDATSRAAAPAQLIEPYQSISDGTYEVPASAGSAVSAPQTIRLVLDTPHGEPDSATSTRERTSPPSETPHHWIGGNDITHCTTCGLEYDHRREVKPLGACTGRPPSEPQVEAVARAIAPLAWVSLGLCDTLAQQNRRKASLKHARAALSAIGQGEDERLAQADAVIYAGLYEASGVSESDFDKWEREAIARHEARQAGKR